MFGQDYINLVKQIFGSDLSCYFPLLPEYLSGGNHLDISGNGCTATPISTALDASSITTLDGRPTVYTNDQTAGKVLVLSGSKITTNFDWTKITVLAHIRVADTAMWDDGSNYGYSRFYKDTTNYMAFVKATTNYRLNVNCQWGGTSFTPYITGISTGGFFILVLTVDVANDVAKLYVNGVAGADITSLPSPPATGSGNAFLFGRYNGDVGWNGAITHYAIANMVATQEQIKALSLGV